jgi:hypothetical protein
MDARPTCIVIGAGIAGLLAADTLTRQGCIATIIEKAKGVGGRMATRRMGGQTFDFGAQSVHGHNPKFESLLASWERAGLVAPWQPDYSARSRDTKRPGPYYKGVPAMTSVPKYIAEGLTVHLQQNVTAVRVSGSAWSVETEHGHVFMSEALIMTAPLPQSLVLLDAGGFALSSDIQKRLRAVEYASCFALMLVLDGPSGLPAPGAMTLDGEPLSWISDNYAKGVAARPGSVTAYASESFSKQMLDEPAERVSHILQEAVKRMVSSRVVSAQLHRWRYCHPIHTLPEGFLDGGILPPLVFAGDMCGAGDCESAALSGIAAADHLHSTFCSLR